MCHLPFLHRGVSIISAEEGVFYIFFSSEQRAVFCATNSVSFTDSSCDCLTIARIKNKTTNKTEGPAGANAG